MADKTANSTLVAFRCPHDLHRALEATGKTKTDLIITALRRELQCCENGKQKPAIASDLAERAIAGSNQ